MRMVEDIVEAVEEAKRGNAVVTKCPAHDDNVASLSVGPGTEQPVVFKCHAMCEAVDIIAAAGMSWAEVCEPLDRSLAPENEWTPRGPASHVYNYTDEEGTLLFQALRVPLSSGGKTFFQRQPKPGGGWTWNLQDVRRVLYRLPQVIEAVAGGHEVWLFEGEKDADRAVADGKVGTTSPMGAGKWRTEFGHALRGARVTIVADNDDTGRKHAREVFDDLVENWECEVRIVETPLAHAKDYSDHRQYGGTDEMLVTTKTSVVEQQQFFGLGIQRFLETTFDRGREIVPGMLAEANVAVIVGPEGHGKSLLMRQMAVQLASGLVPFTLERNDALKCMFIDAENPEFQQMTDWRRLAGLAARHTGRPVPDENLMILSEWRVEPDLTTLDGQAWLYERIMAFRPQVCFLGPVQNLVSRDVKDDEVVRKFKHAINHARSICGTAFVIEHHAPHKQPGDRERVMRPYGSSLFLKWPDFGYGLKPMEDEGRYELYPFRRPRVRSRAWPEEIRWGTPSTMEFPWELAVPDAGGGRVTSMREESA